MNDVATAYEVYCDLIEGGGEVDIDAYCERYPSIRSSLLRQIEVHHYFDFLDARPDWPDDGEKFQGYRIVKKIGEGSYARVYQCIEPRVANRSVVLKLSAPFGCEIDILGQLKHPNIVPIYHAVSDEERGLEGFCMPFLGTSTFCNLLDLAFEERGAPRYSNVITEVARSHGQSHLPRRYPNAVAAMFAKIAEALQYAHGKSIFHGDIKPSNILLSENAEPLILDFNLAASSDMQSLGGTLPYMAPEKLRSLTMSDGDVRENAQSDIYSFGVMLYQVLTGRLPFGTPSRSRDLRVAAADWTLRQSQPFGLDGIDAGLARIIAKCLEPLPERRFSSMRLIADELRKHTDVSRSFRRVGTAAAIVVLSATAAMGYSVAHTPPAKTLGDATALREKQEFSAAERVLLEILASEPEDNQARYALSEIYVLKDQIPLASMHLEALCEAHPDNGRYLASWAYCLAVQGEFATAISKSQDALACEFSSNEVHNNLGRALLERRRYDEAKQHLLAASDLPEAKINLAYVVLRSRAKPVAEDINNARLLVGQGGKPALLAAAVMGMAGEHETAIDFLDAASRSGIDIPAEDLKVYPEFAAVAHTERFKEVINRHIPQNSKPMKFFAFPE